mmetsp:Transcript_25129/g.81081  ORF Transcript_25129/g.81081 Transcript_25129/m.81081 type:complete len:80 (+) Transcript_25129:66-305(+)
MANGTAAAASAGKGTDQSPKTAITSGLSAKDRVNAGPARRPPTDDDDDFSLTSYANGCCICWVSDHHAPIECRLACTIM